VADNDDREEARTQAAADSIRQVIDDPDSAEDVPQIVGAVMGDEELGDLAEAPRADGR
jgi:hypothetical protein